MGAPFHLPIDLTNGVFFSLFFSVAYFLLHRWREKIRYSIPFHVITLSELCAVVWFFNSAFRLVGFFGIDFVRSVFTGNNSDAGSSDSADDFRVIDCPPVAPPLGYRAVVLAEKLETTSEEEDEEIIKAVVEGKTPSYLLESKIGDCKRAATIRREALQRITGKSLVGLPLDGFDYKSILGQCCEMPVGYVQIPVGIAGPLLLDGKEYSVPMATTEGCLVASTNRGSKAIVTNFSCKAVESTGELNVSAGMWMDCDMGVWFIAVFQDFFGSKLRKLE